jgi:hypothetical protein
MGFKIGMMEYCKIILKKISFNRKLFLKEYRKSFRYLAFDEQAQFRKWARQNFPAE